jgi:hypothetical protein
MAITLGCTRRIMPYLCFAKHLLSALATVTEEEGPSPIWCLHNNVLYCTNSGLTKDTEINVLTVTLCLKLKP